MNSGLSYKMIRPERMGYNFAVRPTSQYATRKTMVKKFESQAQLDKHLLKMKRMKKML